MKEKEEEDRRNTNNNTSKTNLSITARPTKRQEAEASGARTIMKTIINDITTKLQMNIPEITVWCHLRDIVKCLMFQFPCVICCITKSKVAND